MKRSPFAPSSQVSIHSFHGTIMKSCCILGIVYLGMALLISCGVNKKNSDQDRTPDLPSPTIADIPPSNRTPANEGTPANVSTPTLEVQPTDTVRAKLHGEWFKSRFVTNIVATNAPTQAITCSIDTVSVDAEKNTIKFFWISSGLGFFESSDACFDNLRKNPGTAADLRSAQYRFEIFKNTQSNDSFVLSVTSVSGRKSYAELAFKIVSGKESLAIAKSRMLTLNHQLLHYRSSVSLETTQNDPIRLKEDPSLLEYDRAVP